MSKINDIAIIFTSIFLEAVPFILLGVIISAIIQEFVSDEFFKKIIPKNPILGSIVGILLGFFIPSCDCAVIPVARRLIKKGVPLNVAVSFMIASPILNPVSIFATVYAFGVRIPEMILYRTVIGAFIAFIVGILISFVTKPNEVLNQIDSEDDSSCCSHGSCCNTLQNSKGIKSKIVNIFNHARIEFLDIMKFLTVGALIAALSQVLISRTALVEFSSMGGGIFETIILMLFAYMISLCSTADSFVAKTFIGQFTNNSILAFLLLGPMIDIKNTLVLVKNFNSKFVVKLLISIFVLVFIFATVVKF